MRLCMGTQPVRGRIFCFFIKNIYYQAVAVADRMRYESIDITYRYVHVFPSTKIEVVLTFYHDDNI